MKLASFIGLRYTGARSRNQLVAFLSRVSMAGLVLGVALLLAVLSIMNGFDRELRERILGLVPQAAIYQRGGVEDWLALRATAEATPGVIAAAPFVQLNGLIGVGTEAEPATVYGIDPELEQSVSKLAEFVPAAQMAALSEGQNLILGRGVAAKLGVTVGDSVMLVVPDASQNAAPKVQYFEVIAELDTGTELDNSMGITHLSAAAAISGSPERVSGVRLRLENLFAAREITYGVVNRLGFGYFGSSWINTHGNLYHAIHMSKRLVALLMSLIVAIAAFNVVATLVMVVTEKRGDIAILRTLGTSTGGIMRIFMVQGAAIGAVGTVLGLIGGVVLTLVIGPLVRISEQLLQMQFLKSDVYPLTYLPTQLKLTDVGWVGALAFALSCCAAIYPAYRASRVAPAEALRYE